MPPGSDPLAEKQVLRQTVRARRRSLRDDEVRASSDALLARIVELVPTGARVAAYVPTRGEAGVGLPALHDAGFDVAFPRCEGPRGAMRFVAGVPTEPGRYGLLEPANGPTIPAQAFDAVLVPGIAFSRDGGRLGQGGGYYDRFLCALRADALRIGVAYSWQVFDALPLEPHDARLTHVITETDTWCAAD